MQKNIGYTSARFVLIDLIGDVIFWPLWWYSTGLAKVARFCGRSIQNRQHQLGIGLWLKNLTVPMFGQYDFEGRLISFLVRFVVICYRSVLLLFWLIWISFLFLLWVIVPVIIFWQLVAHIQWLVQAYA